MLVDGPDSGIRLAQRPGEGSLGPSASPTASRTHGFLAPFPHPTPVPSDCPGGPRDTSHQSGGDRSRAASVYTARLSCLGLPRPVSSLQRTPRGPLSSTPSPPASPAFDSLSRPEFLSSHPLDIGDWALLGWDHPGLFHCPPFLTPRMPAGTAKGGTAPSCKRSVSTDYTCEGDIGAQPALPRRVREQTRWPAAICPPTPRAARPAPFVPCQQRTAASRACPPVGHSPEPLPPPHSH